MTSVLEKQKITRTNSVVDIIYEQPKRSSSSIYPNFEETLRTNFRPSYLHHLLEFLLPSSFRIDTTENLNTISNTVNWIVKLRRIISLRGYWWSEPLVNSFDSEIVLEWWNQGKKVTVYISEASVEFIKVWGADIDNEMEEGIAETTDQIEFLWKWLAS